MRNLPVATHTTITPVTKTVGTVAHCNNALQYRLSCGQRPVQRLETLEGAGDPILTWLHNARGLQTGVCALNLGPKSFRIAGMAICVRVFVCIRRTAVCAPSIFLPYPKKKKTFRQTNATTNDTRRNPPSCTTHL